MSTATTAFPIQREPELLGQTVVVIGGSAGIGFETARRARAEGAKLILTGRDAERLQRTANQLEALSTAAFDATDPAFIERFFRDLPSTIDHVMVTAGRPHYGRLLDLDFEQRERRTIHFGLCSRRRWRLTRYSTDDQLPQFRRTEREPERENKRTS
jgi:short-subunit dehydrogenase